MRNHYTPNKRAQRTRFFRPRLTCRRRRRLLVELLEERTPLNGAPLTSAVPNPTFVALPLPPSTPTNTAAAPANGSQASALGAAAPISAAATSSSITELQGAAAAPDPNTTAEPSGGVIALLFDPHQPKSALPADVTFGGGPPLQQGAPPRFSYNLENNITGAEAMGPEAMFVAADGVNAPGPATERFIDVVATLASENTEAYVVGTPYGVPKFSFGPDTRVSGPRDAAPPAPQLKSSPAPGEESEAGNDGERLPSKDEAPRRDEGSKDSPEDQGAAEAPRQPLRTEAEPSQEELSRQNVVWSAFGDDDFLDELTDTVACQRELPHRGRESAPQQDTQLARIASATEPLKAPVEERASVSMHLLSAASAFVPAAVRNRGPREQPTEYGHASRTADLFATRIDRRVKQPLFPTRHRLKSSLQHRNRGLAVANDAQDRRANAATARNTLIVVNKKGPSVFTLF